MNPKPAILIVEDDTSLSQTLSKILIKRNFQVEQADSLQLALKKIESGSFDLILLDLKLKDGSGLPLFEHQSNTLRNRIIVMTGTATIQDAVTAMKRGAFDFISKPIDRDLLLTTIDKALEINRQLQDFQKLREGFGPEISFGKIIFRSAAMARIISQAKKMARTDNTVLITGETGTGKELLAHAIHNSSGRCRNVFMPVNCASIPEMLAESELFGFRKGAFTDAHRDYAGKFMLSNKGTIFLDEIADLPLSIQAKLLRVLESGEVIQLKSEAPLRTDVRVITATNSNLEEKVKARQFRKDLYYRIDQSRLSIPALRERKEDIIPLCQHFIAFANIAYSRKIEDIEKEAQDLLLAYPWPGNVRELKNCICEIVSTIPGTWLKAEHLPHKILAAPSRNWSVDEFSSLEELEKRQIIRSLELTRNNHKKAAALLGISRAGLYRKIKKYHLVSRSPSR